MKHQILSTTPDISKRMSKVKTKRTTSERKLAKYLWHKGLRYRLNYKKLPGSPDIVITKYKIVIFVDGEFWHGKDWELKKQGLKNNRDYWIEKIEENMKRDKRNDEVLSELGWKIIHFWDKQVVVDIEECFSLITMMIYEKSGGN